jgi:hypothetical protein
LWFLPTGTSTVARHEVDLSFIHGNPFGQARLPHFLHNTTKLFPQSLTFQIADTQCTCTIMANSHKNSSIQAFFSPTPASSSPTKQPPSSSSIGDGFTSEEVQEALKPAAVEPWQPKVDYLDCEIRDLHPGPRAVTFMGRIANIFDVANAPKTPRSAKGCVKLCVKDDHDAVTVRVWYANHYPHVRLGSLVSVWTNHSRFLEAAVARVRSLTVASI